MGGSAILGTSLVDDLVTTVDDLRTLYTDFGLTQVTVNRVKRSWSGSERGEGTVTVLFRTALDPTPLVKQVDEHWKLEAHGRDEQGAVRLEEVSLTYTLDELIGGTLAANEEFYYELVDARGQGIDTHYYVPKDKPYTDRDKSIGWIVLLERCEIKNP